MSLCMRTEKCDYCSAESTHSYDALTRMHGIKTCAAHDAWAVRDIAAYLHKRNIILVEDFLKRFPQLSGVASIKVPRKNGGITEGAKVSLSEFSEFNFVRLSSSGQWVIRVTWVELDEPFSKDIKIADLTLSGIDVRPITAVLETGFYKTQYDAHELAKAAGILNMEQAAEVLAHQGSGVVCRAFVPEEGVKYIKV